MPDPGVTDLLTYKDLRRLLRCSQSTAERLAVSGAIRSVQIGTPGSRKPRRMFRMEDVQAFLEAQAADS